VPAEGRFLRVNTAIRDKVIIARFKLTGLKAALKYDGEVILTHRVAANIATIVNHTGQRALQKITSTRARNTSAHPTSDITVPSIELEMPAS
jgi:hypothetical protein